MRWDWAIGLKLDELNDSHLQAAYKLNWDNLCKFDSCRKNCKRILCLACFDKSWIDNENANSSGYDNYEATNCEQERTDLKSFVGLKNLGATCYVNCLLQLWFHNPALRKAIYEWDKDSKVEIHGDTGDELVQAIESSSKDYERSSRSLSKRPREDENVQTSSPAKKLGKISTERITSSIKSSSNNIKDTSTLNQESRLKTTTSTSSSTIIPLPPPTVETKDRKQQKDTAPIEQLQLIFARLQFTNKKSIDPFNFIDSLALNAAEQQDAQEFGNLFMEFLEKSFANQNSSFVSKIIQNQFCGRYSYATICDHCKHSSLSDSNFYELDLSIQNLETLHDCLNEFFRPVPLDGKYNCRHCQKAQSARRKIILKTLPPTLNLQLLRFVYDVQRNIRQKLNSFIIFPEVLDMTPYLTDVKSKSDCLDIIYNNNNNINNSNINKNRYLSINGTSSKRNNSNIYILSAVLIHRGSSPHSGHYIAHIKDRITKDWYKFNDDSVERIGPQLQVSTDGENITIVEDKAESIKIADPNGGRVTKLESKSLKSKTAYMLVYQAIDNEALSYPSDHSEEWQLPDHLQTAVAEENSKSVELFESLQIAKEVDQQIILARKNQIRTIYEKLVCRDPSDKFEFIEKSWLQNWLTNSSTSAKFPPIDNSELLCIHDKLDFRKMDQVKCVRSEGADMLYKEFGGGPRLNDAMCRDCVELEVKLIQLKDRMKEDQKYISSQAKFKLEADYDFADAYLVGRRSYRDWQALVMVQFEKSYPEIRSRERESNQQNSSDEDDHKDRNQNESSESKKGSNEDASDDESDDEAIEKFVFNSDILCEHDQLINDPLGWRMVPKEVWMIFKHYFGNDPSRPLIECNANTIMCPDCKRQEIEQKEFVDIQKQKASEQKARLPDLFHNRKRASWYSMQPEDEYFALDRQFLAKWQKFLRNPCNQERPEAIKNRERLVCEHGKSLYDFSNSNPVLPECPFVLVNRDELEGLKQYYPVDFEIRFTIDPRLAEEKFKLHVASLKTSPSKKSNNPADSAIHVRQLESGDDTFAEKNAPQLIRSIDGYESKTSDSSINHEQKTIQPDSFTAIDKIDLSEIDWSECVVSEPDYCSDCHEMLKQDELKKLLNYESATIYITKVENPCVQGPQENPNLAINGSSSALNENCDIDPNLASSNTKKPDVEMPSSDEVVFLSEESYPFKRRKKIYLEDEANDFIPPGVSKQPTQPNPPSNSILRRTTRRNRNREQAYTIKPTQTLLQLKKEIFSRCQVLPVDQRLFLNDILLDDNSKTMSELRIVPNCSLKLEVSYIAPTFDNITSKFSNWTLILNLNFNL